MHRLLLASQVFLVLAGAIIGPAQAQTVIEEWYSAQVPPPPPIAPVTIDAKKTALLLMDFNRDVCNPGHRVRCAAALPKLAKLIAEARAHAVPVVYVIQQRASAADIPPEIAPAPGEPVFHPQIRRWLNKFVSAELVKYLSDKGVDTVILTGTSPNSTVLFAAGGAADTGFKVIVPVDGIPADTIYQEQFTAWDLANGAVLQQSSTLTRLDMIRF